MPRSLSPPRARRRHRRQEPQERPVARLKVKGKKAKLARALNSRRELAGSVGRQGMLTLIRSFAERRDQVGAARVSKEAKCLSLDRPLTEA